MADVEKIWRISCIFLLCIATVCAKQKSQLYQLNEETWKELLEGEWLVKFYAPWCPACKALIPVWDSVATWDEDLEIKVAKIDVTENPGLSGRFLVTSLPTVYHVKDGNFRMYRGPRTENDIVSFVDDKKWQETDPVPWYSSPTSVHMGALGMFFKVSMSIRDLHDSMTSEYGIPVWGSYTIFAVATIILGLLLGLLIVFMCDVILPSSPPEQSYINTHQSSASGFRASPRHYGDYDKDSDTLIDDLPAKPQAEDQPSGLGQEADSNSQEEDAGLSQDEGDCSQDEGDRSQADDGSQAELSQDDKDEPSEPQSKEGAVGGDRDSSKTARQRKVKARTD